MDQVLVLQEIKNFRLVYSINVINVNKYFLFYVLYVSLVINISKGQSLLFDFFLFNIKLN